MVFRMYYTPLNLSLAKYVRLSECTPLDPMSIIGANTLDTYIKRQYCKRGLVIKKLPIKIIESNIVYGLFTKHYITKIRFGKHTLLLNDIDFYEAEIGRAHV